MISLIPQGWGPCLEEQVNLEWNLENKMELILLPQSLHWDASEFDSKSLFPHGCLLGPVSLVKDCLTLLYCPSLLIKGDLTLFEAYLGLCSMFLQICSFPSILYELSQTALSDYIRVRITFTLLT